MKIEEIKNALELNVAQEKYRDDEIDTGYTSDLLSDVMANAPENAFLITIQAHKNTVAVATLSGISGIVICNNRNIPQDMIESARNENIAIFFTGENQFTVSGKLYHLLHSERSTAGT